MDISYAEALVDKAWELGIRSFDVANSYGNGHAEILLGQCLKKYPREEYVLLTKGSLPIGPTPYHKGLSRKHRILWSSGWWDNITYSTPFTILVDYKRTGSNTEHMHIINSSPGPGVSVERGFDIACRNGYQNNLITGVIKNWVNYGVTSPNTALINTQHILTGFIYDGNGHITRVQDGIITNETYTITPDHFPDFTGTVFCIGGLNNYYPINWPPIS